VGRRSQHLVFYCHPFEFLSAKDQIFPQAMSKWNQWGMSSANCGLVETLIGSILKLGYVPVPMTENALQPIELEEPAISNATDYQSDPA